MGKSVKSTSYMQDPIPNKKQTYTKSTPKTSICFEDVPKVLAHRYSLS